MPNIFFRAEVDSLAFIGGVGVVGAGGSGVEVRPVQVQYPLPKRGGVEMTRLGFKN